jgi:hypothetical protein
MGHLELRTDDGGLRHYLEGEPVSAGAVLEVRKYDGSWVAGRYEWSWRPDELPQFYTDGLAEFGLPARISSADILRWPGSK